MPGYRNEPSRVVCPHCGAAMKRIRTKVHSPLMKEVMLVCSNEECEAVLGMVQEIFRTIKPSHKPKADIDALLS